MGSRAAQRGQQIIAGNRPCRRRRPARPHRTAGSRSIKSIVSGVADGARQDAPQQGVIMLGKNCTTPAAHY